MTTNNETTKREGAVEGWKGEGYCPVCNEVLFMEDFEDGNMFCSNDDCNFRCINDYTFNGYNRLDKKAFYPAAPGKEEVDKGEISDGHHTFSELYDHRHALFMSLMKCNPGISWRANVHDDGTMYDGWFIAGMRLPTGDISYHLPVQHWELLDNVGIATTNKAPQWDGYTPDLVIHRLMVWLRRTPIPRPDPLKLAERVLAELQRAGFVRQSFGYDKKHERGKAKAIKVIAEVLEGK